MSSRPSLSYYSYDSLGNPWVSGGGAVRDFEVLRRIARHADVTLYTARYPGFRDRTEDGVRIRGIGFGRSNWICRLTFTLYANARVLFDRADMSGSSPSIYAPLLAGMLRGRRHYIVFHHYVGEGSFRKFGLLGWIPYLSECILLRGGRRYMTVNAAVQERLRRVNPKADVLLSANGLDAALFDTVRTSSSGVPFALFLGRFDVYMKGIDLLIAAWSETLVPRGIDLVIAGRGTAEDIRALEALVPESGKGRIHVESDVSEERKRELLASCLFFVSPSRFEGFGIAALEANAAGVAVLATDNEGFRDSLALGETALAVPVDDETALRAGLIRLTEDAALRESLGRAGRERARGFGWDAIAEKEWAWIRGTAGAGRVERLK